jgi:hypothetical protein
MAEHRTIETEQAPPESIFHQLFGGRSHVEVNVSKAFAMCFRESPPFAQAVVRLLCKTCGVPRPSANVRWHCHTEVAFSKGRPDIEIYAPGVAPFRLESKVGASLTKNQLRRYRFERKNKYLIALTKRPPNVPRHWIDKQRAFAIRWQDVHRAVAGATTTRRERYLPDAFCLYLEELGMAHREDVRPDDLKRLHELFSTIAPHKQGRMSPRNAFEVAESCLHLLREVARAARDEIPVLQNWSRRGPLYSKMPDSGRRYWHHLGFHFNKSRAREMAGAGFSFRQGSRQIKWEVWRTRKNDGLEKQQMRPVTDVCGKKKALDRARW